MCWIKELPNKFICFPFKIEPFSFCLLCFFKIISYWSFVSIWVCQFLSESDNSKVLIIFLHSRLVIYHVLKCPIHTHVSNIYALQCLLSKLKCHLSLWIWTKIVEADAPSCLFKSFSCFVAEVLKRGFG